MTTSRSQVRLWDAVTGKSIAAPIKTDDDGRDLSIDAAVFSPEGKSLITTGPTLKKSDKSVEFFALRLWQAATGRPVGQPRKLESETYGVAFSPDCSRILTGSQNKTAQMWDATKLEPIGSPLEHPAPVNAVSFSHDGRLFLTVSGNVVRLWDTGTRTPIGRALELRSAVAGAVFSLDDLIIATRGTDGAAQLWDVATGKRVGPSLQQAGRGLALAFSPDGKTFAVASDKTVRLLKLPAPMNGEPERLVRWTQVVTGSEIDEQGAVRKLDAKTWQERRYRLDRVGGPPSP